MPPTPTTIRHRERYPTIVAFAALAELDGLIEDLEAAQADKEHAEEEVGEERDRADRAEDQAEVSATDQVAAERERDEARDTLREVLSVVWAADRWQHNPTGFPECSALRQALAGVPTDVLHQARCAR